MNDADRFDLAVSQIFGKRIMYKVLTGKTLTAEEETPFLSGRAGGSGRFDLPLWTAPVWIRFRLLAIGTLATYKRGVWHGQHGTYESVESRGRLLALVTFW